MKRIHFIFTTTKLIALCMTIAFLSCKNANQKEKTIEKISTDQSLFFKLSLAQWSVHKQIQSGEMNPFDFPQKASELGFEGVEYVNALFKPQLAKFPSEKEAMAYFVNTLKEKSEMYKVRNVLIMVDGEGELAVENETERNQTVENHKKWVDAAKALGCHSIRVNLSGSTNPEIWKKSAVDGLSKLVRYAADKNINVIVENHGGLSSNAALLVEVIKTVNKPNCGVLPDFGNFCIAQENGKCIEEYDRYLGISQMMPVAKAVSAKSYDFDENGNETKLDFTRILQTVKDAGYTNFIGVEYEGSRLSEEEGIMATKNLLIATAKKLN